MNCYAGEDGFIVNKRFGVANSGRVDSVGKVRIGSVFAQMAHLPVVDHTHLGEDLSLEKFLSLVEYKTFHKCKDTTQSGLYLTSESDISIDNLQGVCTIHTNRDVKINLRTVGSAKLVINAPNATVSMNLKSLHDESFIHCKNLEILVGENFNACKIYDIGQGKTIKTTVDDDTAKLVSKHAPTLHILSEHNALDVKVMSDFEILRQQIMSKLDQKNKTASSK